MIQPTALHTNCFLRQLTCQCVVRKNTNCILYHLIYFNTANYGHLQSLNYPQSYPNNMDAVWKVHVEEPLLIMITFYQFDIEGGSCNFDYLEVY